MYDEQQLRDLVELARRAGADLVVTHAKKAHVDEGRVLIDAIQVRSGIAGIGPHQMSAFYACERLREAKAKGQLGPVIRSVTIGPMPRPLPEGLSDPMPRVTAKLSNGDTRPLFEFYPDEIRFEEYEFIGKTAQEAVALKARKDREFLAGNQAQHPTPRG